MWILKSIEGEFIEFRKLQICQSYQFRFANFEGFRYTKRDIHAYTFEYRN